MVSAASRDLKDLFIYFHLFLEFFKADGQFIFIQMLFFVFSLLSTKSDQIVSLSDLSFGTVDADLLSFF